MRDVLKPSVRVLAISALLAGFAQAQVTPPPTPATFFSFFGIPQGIQKVRGALTNRRGNHPRMEPKPALKALADQANLESPNAAIKKAAEIKAAEDLKPQKIKAIKYLAKIGCGCYDKDGSITDALVAASDDCTPDVRLATVEAIYEAASGACCSRCGATCCCNEKMAQRLAEMAYMRDETGCYVEPNAEVRAAAARALMACCPDDSPVVEITGEEEQEDDYQGEGPVDEEYQGEGEQNIETIPESNEQPRPLTNPSEQTLLRSDVNQWDGVLLHVDAQRGIAHVHLTQRDLTLPVGAQLHAYGVVDGRELHVGTFVVYESFEGSANVQAIDEQSKQAIVKGVAVLTRPNPAIASVYQPVQRQADVPPSTPAAPAEADVTPSAPAETAQTAPVAPRANPSVTIPARRATSLGRLRGLLREVSR